MQKNSFLLLHALQFPWRVLRYGTQLTRYVAIVLKDCSYSFRRSHVRLPVVQKSTAKWKEGDRSLARFFEQLSNTQ